MNTYQIKLIGGPLDGFEEEAELDGPPARSCFGGNGWYTLSGLCGYTATYVSANLKLPPSRTGGRQ